MRPPRRRRDPVGAGKSMMQPETSLEIGQIEASGGTLVAEVDLRDPLPELPQREGDRVYSGAWVLVRLYTQPIGVVRFPYSNRSARSLLAEAIDRDLGKLDVLREAVGPASVREHLLSRPGIPHTTRTIGYLREQEDALRDGPSVSVVVCTRNRPELLASCLRSLQGQRYPRFEIIVVDNSTGAPEVEALTRELSDSAPIQYVVEPRMGLSRARNRGTASATGDIVAFLDDDATADECWIVELARPYLSDDGVASVNGLILPAELRTPSQEWLSRYGGHSKGRGFLQEVFDAADRRGQSPLYPLPPFGAGGNMSFRRAVLHDLRGFDEALGAGTPAGGAEETFQFTRLLLQGHRIVYRPSALVWHRDHETMEEIRQQLRALGTSITAYYTALLVSQPSLVLPLARLLPRGIRELRSGPRSVRKTTVDGDYPRTLLRAHRRGMIAGPAAYVRGRRARWR